MKLNRAAVRPPKVSGHGGEGSLRFSGFPNHGPWYNVLCLDDWYWWSIKAHIASVHFTLLLKFRLSFRVIFLGKCIDTFTFDYCKILAMPRKVKNTEILKWKLIGSLQTMSLPSPGLLLLPLLRSMMKTILRPRHHPWWSQNECQTHESNTKCKHVIFTEYHK